MMCFGVSSFAQEDRRIPPVSALQIRLDSAFSGDNIFDPSIWDRAPVISRFFETQPRERESVYPTTASVLLSNKAFYIRLVATDSDSARINAAPAQRDKAMDGQDFFTVYLDPIGNRKFAQFFQVNAAGAIGDGIFNEASQTEDYSPDFQWTARSQRTNTGWMAVLRIPYISLRHTTPTPQTWSLLVVRGLSRDDTYRLANAQIPLGRSCWLCYAQSLDGMGGIEAGRELTLTPNVTYRKTREVENNSGATASSRKDKFIASLDVKFRPTADLVFDATINPDFSQVELDTPQLAANAQFALFLQEKRPFFLEGADILTAPQSEIYTRSITDPAWGARLTKRDGSSDVSVLTVHDEGGGFILIPGAYRTRFAVQDSASQATIARGRIHSDTTTLGVTLTDRRYEKNAAGKEMNNQVGGADFVWRPRSELRIAGSGLFSRTLDERNYAPGTTQRDGYSGYVNAEWSGPNWYYYGWLSRSGRDFRTDNGFTTQVGVEETYHEIKRTFREVGGFTSISPYFNLLRKHDVSGNGVLNFNQLGVSMSINKHNFNVELRPEQKVRYLPEGPTWDRTQIRLNADGAPGTWLSNYSVQLVTGDRGDVANNRMGRGYLLTASAKFRLAEKLAFSPQLEEGVVNSKNDVVGSKTILKERGLQLTTIYNISATDDLRTVYQYSGVRRAPSLFQSPVSPFEKTETLSVVYGHRRSLGTSLYIGLSTTRTHVPGANFNTRNDELFVKASFAFDAFSQLFP